MNKLSFDIKTTLDFFKKLLEDYHEFCNNSISSSIALNCAMTAWHLSDWIYHEFNLQLSTHFRTLPLFQNDLKIKCSSLQIMQDLCYGTKHYKLTWHKPIVNETNFHIGDFDSDFSRDFDISILVIELNDGTNLFFEDEIKNVITFWTQYLQSTLNIL